MRLGFAGIIAVAFLALEMVGIYLIAGQIGAGLTTLWLVAAVVAGIAVIRRAGAGFLPGLADSLQGGQPPFAFLWATGRRFLAGALLILPGAAGDLIALALLLWPAPAQSPQRQADADDKIIEGEFRREDTVADRLPPTQERA
jgi:UPF0716 family protein affecting phage T7 exclusion